MTVLLEILCLGLFGAAGYFYIQNKRLESELAKSRGEIISATQECDRVRTETALALDEAQKLFDGQVADLRAEAERIRKHYEAECRNAMESAHAELKKARADAEELKRFTQLRDAESDVRKTLEAAIAEAESLRSQAQAIMEQARIAAEAEKTKATERARIIYEQADARLNQATQDAGKIIAQAESKAKEIGGDAYDALRDKQLLERAAEAMRNIVDGYGDRYIIPTHSLLDDLAVEFGYTSAGESLKSARAQARRMVEQGEAATCDYVETNRRETAIRFVVDAFNGRVDAILSRVKRDNHGQLEQEIRDAFSLVNLNGQAFRNARIHDAYLNARLDELKWAVVVQELARRQMEEQRELKARMRDEEKARREYELQMKRAAAEEEAKRKAIEEKEIEMAAVRQALERAAAHERAQLEQKLASMQQTNEGLRQELAAATERKLTIAQQTKTGTVYIISNLGAFGDGIYKIGQTRRPDPQERIDELGDASVPFDFDVHAWIKSDNAPALEHRLQRRFLSMQVNKVNSRKEFFRVTLKELREEIDRLSAAEPMMVTHWTETAAATQYRESLDIEGDPQKLQKWLARQEALSDRALRLNRLNLTEADVTEAAEPGQEA
jgi:hypothetical protein